MKINLFSNIGSKIVTLGIFDSVLNTLWDMVMKVFYGLYFGLVKAIAWALDMLTQLFFIFAGMTPIGTNNTANADEGIDIVNFFLTQKSFQKAYLYLCLIALGLIVVFAIGKIIKQDYFDRSGPRSKAPIFRNIALSFIAFICIIPVFYFMIDAVGALALLVMKALGYKGGGLGTMLFNMCWEDGGESIRSVAIALRNHSQQPAFEWNTVIANIDTRFGSFDISSAGELYFPSDIKPSKVYDPDNFGWYSNDTFYVAFWNSETSKPTNFPIQFYWWMFLLTGPILIVNLGQMMLAMVTRLFKLVSLFVVAPSPIAQIVLDDGQKFKGWKDQVVQEALKVVGCVMSFMIFMMMASFVPQIDLMRFAYTSESASASLLESGDMTTELSNSISALYYYGDNISWVDRAINSLGRCMLLIAGVGAIKDIDGTITPLISGGKSSMDMGNTGSAIPGSVKSMATGALQLTRKGIGLAAAGVGAIVSGGAAIGGFVGKMAEAGAERRQRSLADKVEKEKEKQKNLDNKLNGGNGGDPMGSGDGRNEGDPGVAAPTSTTPQTPDDSASDEAQTPDSQSPREPEQKDANADGASSNNSGSTSQKEKFENARNRMQNAKKDLEAAKKRDAKKNDIKNDIEKIEKSKTLSEDEKKEKISRLNQQFNDLDKEGPSLADAQNAFDTANADYNMESRDYKAQGGDISPKPIVGEAREAIEPQEVENVGTVGDSNVNNNSSEDRGVSPTSGTNTTTNGGNSSANSEQTKKTKKKPGQAAIMADAAWSIVKSGFNFAKTAVTEGASTAAILAKTAAGMAGVKTKDGIIDEMGKTFAGIDADLKGTIAKTSGNVNKHLNNMKPGPMQQQKKETKEELKALRKSNSVKSGMLRKQAIYDMSESVHETFDDIGSGVQEMFQSMQTRADERKQARIERKNQKVSAPSAPSEYNKTGIDMKTVVNNIKTGAQEKFTKVGTGIKTAANNIKTGAKDVFNDIGSGVKQTFSDIGTSAQEIFSDIGSGVQEKFQNMKANAENRKQRKIEEKKQKEEQAQAATQRNFTIQEHNVGVGQDDITSGMSAISSSTSGVSEVLEGAGSVSAGVNAVVKMADETHASHGSPAGSQLESRVDAVNLARAASSVIENNDIAHSYANGVREYVAMNSDEPERIQRFTNMAKEFNGSSNSNVVTQVAAMQGIQALNAQMKTDYNKAMSNVNLSESEKNRIHSEYSQKGQQLDNAYRYVNGDTSVGREAYDAVRGQIESTKEYVNASKKKKGNYDSKSLKAADERYQKDMLARASAGETRAKEQKDSFEKTINSKMSEMSARDKVTYHQTRFECEKDRYDRASKYNDLAKMDTAQNAMKVCGQDLRSSVSDLRKKMAEEITKGAQQNVVNDQQTTQESQGQFTIQEIDVGAGHNDIVSGLGVVNDETTHGMDIMMYGAGPVISGTQQVLDTASNIHKSKGSPINSQLSSTVNVNSLAQEAEKVSVNNINARLHSDGVKAFNNTAHDLHNYKRMASDYAAKKSDAVSKIASSKGIQELNSKLTADYNKSMANINLSDEVKNQIHSDYISKGQQLDNAYRYVQGDTTVGKEAYEAVRDQIEATEKYQEASTVLGRGAGKKKVGYDAHTLMAEDEKFRKDMTDRANAGVKMSSDKYNDFQTIESREVNKMSAYDKTAYYKAKFDKVSDRYEQSMNSNDKARMNAAQFDMRTCGDDLRYSVSDLRKKMTEEVNKKND